MDEKQLEQLLGEIANYYLSIPVAQVRKMITERYPEVAPEQLEIVLKRCNMDHSRQRCGLEIGLTREPELAAQRLIDLPEIYKIFLGARRDCPYAPAPAEYHYKYGDPCFDIPEIDSIRDCFRTELGVNNTEIEDFVAACVYALRHSVWQGRSWFILFVEVTTRAGFRYKSSEQLKGLIKPGQKLYQALPNPAIGGQRPMDVANPPVLLDDIPENIEDLPCMYESMEEALAIASNIGTDLGYIRLIDLMREHAYSDEPYRRKGAKIGRNDPCPCGSGKKYKKCCGK